MCKDLVHIDGQLRFLRLCSTICGCFETLKYSAHSGRGIVYLGKMVLASRCSSKVMRMRMVSKIALSAGQWTISNNAFVETSLALAETELMGDLTYRGKLDMLMLFCLSSLERR